jgi:hypothetical protein
MNNSTADYQAFWLREQGNETNAFGSLLEWHRIQHIRYNQQRHEIGTINKHIDWNPAGDGWLTVTVGKQETYNIYDEYIIHGFKTKWSITYLESGAGWQRGEATTVYKWFPLNIDIVDNMKPQLAEQLMQASIYGSVSLVDKQDIPWYTDTWFKVIVVIITVVLVIFSAGWATALGGWLAGAMGLAAASAATAFIVGMLKLAFSFLISMSITFLVPGTEGQILAAVVTIGMNVGPAIIAQGGVQAYGASVAAGFMTAEGFLKAVSFATKLVKLGYDYLTDQRIEAYQEKVTNLMEDEKKKMEEMEEAYATLDTSVPGLDPFLIGRKVIDYLAVDLPEAYYARALDSDPNATAMYAANNFVDIATTLPKAGSYNIVDAQFLAAENT